MAKKQVIEEDNTKIGHNSDGQAALVIESAKQMAEIDAQRKELNERAAEIRGVLKERGIDTDAFKDAYSYFKKRRHERDGYDESHKLCWDALNDADTGELFENVAKAA